MIPLAPLQLIDNLIIGISVGDVLLVVFLLTLPVGIIQSSGRIIAIIAIAFGGLFALVPSLGGGELYYSYFGIMLLVIGPLLYVTAGR